MNKPSPIAYPFLTRREILSRIDSDVAFMRECALVLEARTEQRESGNAPPGKAWGWMSSERAAAGHLVARLRGKILVHAEASQLGRIVRRYSRQIADNSRQLALREDPGLAAIAAKFGVKRTDVEARPPSGDEAVTHAGERRTGLNSEPKQADHASPTELGREVDDHAARALAFLEGHPGERAEVIARALGTTTAMLAPALREMVKGKRVRKQGVGRGTRYFAR